MSIRKNRKMVYIGERIRAFLDGRKGALSTAINTLADRYLAMVERAGKTPMMDFHAELYVNVLREYPGILTAHNIGMFPAMCEDWLKRNPKFPQEPGKTAVMILKNSSYHDLVALVDRMERLV